MRPLGLTPSVVATGAVMRRGPDRVPGRTPTARRRMERDVVCGMQVEPEKAAGSSEYNGKTYYFCSKTCQAKFDGHPAQFAM